MSETMRIFAPSGDASPRGPTVAEIVGQFLEYSERDSSPRAHADRRHILELFCAEHGQRLVEDCKPFHLELWVQKQTQWKSDWTVKRAIASVKRPMSWAFKLGIIDRHPFASVTHRAGDPGQPIEPADFQRLLRATGPIFRRVLIFLRFSGCRPCEMSRIQWDFIDFERGLIILRKHKTAKTRRDRKPRIIILHPCLVKLLIWIRRHETPGPHVFLNRRGEPWSRNALCLRVRNLRNKIGLPDTVKLYGLRHAFGTQAILQDVNLKTLSVLMGHTSTKTTEIYTHVAGRVDHLQAALGQVFKHGKPR